ncbi:MAG: serine/threonine-protein kinase [Mariprofundaceae bacterium]|nr:serine/threonine-protein kinase [Mariprofundaceae bacterium]
MNNSAFWKSDWFLGLILALLFAAAYVTGFTQSLENKAYDVAVAASIQPADSRIVILDIDDDSIDRIGHWPWSRSIIAEAINKLSDAGARLIGVDIFFSEEKPKPKGLQSQLQLAELLRQQGKHREAAKVLAEARAMDEDRALIDAVRKSGNTLIPVFFDLGASAGRGGGNLPAYLRHINIKSTGTADNVTAPLSAVKMRYPFPKLGSAAAGLGHLTVLVDEDGVVRSMPLVIDYHGRLIPSMSLAMAAKDLRLTMDDIRVNFDTSSIELGAFDIVTGPQMRLYPAFFGDESGKSFAHYSFHDVYSGRIPAKIFKNKIVLIGPTATGVGEAHVTPVNTHMHGVELHAHVLQSLLDRSFFTRPAWAGIAELLLLVAVGLYLAAALPRLGAGVSAAMSLILLLGLLGTNFIMLTGSMLWLQTVTAATLLLVGHLLLTTKRHFASEEERQKVSADSAETNKMLGLSFQSQGMLDMAFDKFRKCPMNDDIMATLYNLALDFERKRQFNKATSVYEYMSEYNPSYKDLQARLERVKNAGETMIFGASTTGGMSSLLVTGGAKPTLGRYEIVKELGKGAMGTVYLGRDPKINRQVAIKTMALSQEFEADELEGVKERFFREAETAGRLNHPNIVTIFDAGEEHDLAYIAMEFLSGTDLSRYTKEGKLFPPAAVLKIAGKVAEALHYAHSMDVIHRDIKPANIMLMADKTVKVTDFGIARITASSKTKTGVVLGTPSYMSPEQLSGKHVDGRSDLFSLGVMIYEMLTGKRPFRGDSMATLMFQIANEPHPDIREHRPDLPESISKLIDKALAKDAEARFANGQEMVQAIIRCLRDLPPGRGGSA